MSFSYYIYYRIDPLRTKAAEQAIAQLMTAMQISTGARARLSRKRDEPNLWMETYDNILDGAKFERDLAKAVSENHAENFLVAGSVRRIECFESF